MANAPRLDLDAILAPARRRLAQARVELWAVRGLAAGAAAGLLVILAAHARPWGGATVAAMLLVGLGGLAGMGWGVRLWPDTAQAARAVDRHFALSDRVTTALETASSDRPVTRLLHADVARRLEGLTISEAGRLPRRGGELGAAGATLVLLAALVAVWVPERGGVGAPASSDSRVVKQAATVKMPQLIGKVGQLPTSRQRTNPALRALSLALLRLQRQLARTSTRPAALRTISTTQQELHRIALSVHPVRPQAVSQLNHALAPQMSARQRAGAASSRRGALAAAARTLNRLARSLSRLTPSQRAALAGSLARAANTTSDSRLRASLHQAASSLGYNDSQSAARALQQAASTLSQTQNSEAVQARASEANSRLDALKGDISGVRSGLSGASVAAAQSSASGQAPGKPGQGTGRGTGTGRQGRGSGQGAGQGRGSGSGQGRGSSGGHGSGHGQGAGTGSGSGGQGGTGGHGAGGGRSGAGPQGRGRTGASVYIPGKAGKGAHIIRNGPNGAPLPGYTVPYRQVVGQYTQSAHAALDRASLPPDLQTYVRGYFSAIAQ